MQLQLQKLRGRPLHTNPIPHQIKSNWIIIRTLLVFTSCQFMYPSIFLQHNANPNCNCLETEKPKKPLSTFRFLIKSQQQHISIIKAKLHCISRLSHFWNSHKHGYGSDCDPNSIFGLLLFYNVTHIIIIIIQLKCVNAV